MNAHFKIKRVGLLLPLGSGGLFLYRLKDITRLTRTYI
jgi:hypothetical protein